jgi:hypothetical protein
VNHDADCFMLVWHLIMPVISPFQLYDCRFIGLNSIKLGAYRSKMQNIEYGSIILRENTAYLCSEV